jgi:CheY-like chemotaxis protein
MKNALKFLMIDDNQIEHLIVQRMIDKFKIFPETIHSTNARLTMDFFEEHYRDPDELPDVIFLDLNMPGYNGWDFLISLSKFYHLIKKNIDIYVLSSSISPDDRLLPQRYGFVKAFLSKPIKMETLLNLSTLYQQGRRAAI